MDACPGSIELQSVIRAFNIVPNQLSLVQWCKPVRAYVAQCGGFTTFGAIEKHRLIKKTAKDRAVFNAR
jgi:hypothetical protein